VEMGTLALDASKGRQSDDQITFFKSVGTAVLDVVVAHKIYEKGKKCYYWFWKRRKNARKKTCF
ncbi:hypothetical protein PT077_09090, partial [Erysipelothrix rhusiopathiae]|nr:hypothetical protein [Erysipelothrix rhusiopathiae]